MTHPAKLFYLLLALSGIALCQSVPKALLSNPTHLTFDEATREASAGSNLKCTVTLKNAQNQPVPAPEDLRLQVETPSRQLTIVLPKGQSSASFDWQPKNAGVARMTVRSEKLHPATALVLVTPHAELQPEIAPKTTVPAPSPPTRGVIERRLPTGATEDRLPPFERRPPFVHVVPAPAAVPPEATAQPAVQATKLQLFVTPVPIYGDAVNRKWQANVSVAAFDNQGALAPVASDVPIHFNVTLGSLSAADIVLASGRVSNFQEPLILTSQGPGEGRVEAISSLVPGNVVVVQYLLPPPKQLRLGVIDTPTLSGSGSSAAHVQVCLLDESGALTSSDHDIAVQLTASGQLTEPNPLIRRDSPCSGMIVWSAAAGKATMRAEGEELKADVMSIPFPSFPWYLSWLAAAGGLLGAVVRIANKLFSRRGWQHTWRGLLLGSVMGMIFYLFARFGAISMQGSPINVQNIPVVSGVGAMLLGFLGGFYGIKVWKIDEDKPKPAAASRKP